MKIIEVIREYTSEPCILTGIPEYLYTHVRYISKPTVVHEFQKVNGKWYCCLRNGDILIQEDDPEIPDDVLVGFAYNYKRYETPNPNPWKDVEFPIVLEGHLQRKNPEYPTMTPREKTRACEAHFGHIQ